MNTHSPRIPQLRAALSSFLQDMVQMKPAPGRNITALRWVVPLAIGLLAAGFLYGPQSAVHGSIAARVSGAARDEPLRRRLRVAIPAFIFCQAYLVLGMLASRWVFTEILAIVTVTSLGLWVWYALAYGVPGRINMAFATAFGVYLGSEGQSIPEVLHVNLVVWLICMAAHIGLMFFDFHRAERTAVEKAEKAVDFYIDLAEHQKNAEKSAVDDARLGALVALNGAWTTFATNRRHMSRTAEALAERINHAYFRLIGRLENNYYPHTPEHSGVHAKLAPKGLPPATYVLRDALHYGARPRMVAIRTFVALLIMELTVLILDTGHSYWAALASLIVLQQGATRFDSVIRGVQRVIGTAIGLVVYLGLLIVVDNLWVRLIIVIFCIYGLECFTARNYGIAVTFITVYALLLLPTPTPGFEFVIVHDRFLETCIGITAALIGVWLINDARAIVYRSYRTTLAAMIEVLNSIATEEFSSPRAVNNRRNLFFELSRSAEMLERSRGDAPQDLEPWVQVEREVFRLTGVVLAASWRMTSMDEDTTQHTRHAAQWASEQLEGLIHAFPITRSTTADAQECARSVNAVRMEFIYRSF
ncbi:MAG: FUSC family protein [Corynebacterium sp.]|nr:FUSC family protein [Corynebacterium sp.]